MNSCSTIENSNTRAEPTRAGRTFCPAVDIVETGEELLVTADMPGTSGDAIDVRVENGRLTIHGRVTQRQPDGTTYLLREYGVGDYHREFDLGEAIDSERISAEYKHGVLTLRLPKAASVRPRKIAVKAD